MSSSESSSGTPTAPTQGTSPHALQFDVAERSDAAPDAAAGVVCARCGSRVTTSYYHADGEVVCEACRDRAIEAARPVGHRASRLARAFVFGLGAAIAGSAIWFAIIAATDSEFGLIAILIGFMVGKAVFVGSRRRGGPAYQAIAIALTYFSIVSSYVPLIIREAIKQPPAGAVSDSTSSATSSSESRTTGSVPGAILALFAFALLAPITTAADNPIGLLIIAIGLWEAWRRTRRVEMLVAGPFEVGPAASAGAPVTP